MSTLVAEKPAQEAGTKSHFMALVPALAVTVVALLFGSLAVYAPPRTGEMAVVFSPGTNEATAYGAIIQAGGRFVSGSRFPNVVIAYAPDENFRNLISNYGGWFTFAATGLCSPTPVTNSL